MRLLIAEDHQYGELYAKELRADFGHEVVCAASPAAAMTLLSELRFDAVIADLLFEDEIAAFETRAAARSNPVTGRLIMGGLSVLRAARNTQTGPVVWTTGSQDRRLHLQFAYEKLGVRCFCLKRNSVVDLHFAATAAAKGREWVSAVAEVALPAPDAASLEGTIMSGPSSKRAYWRVLALGVTDAKVASKLVGVGNIKNLVAAMSDDLYNHAPYRRQHRIRGGGAANVKDLQNFAIDNREFFLDEAVREEFP